MTLEELNAKREELRSKVDLATTQEELTELRSEIEKLDKVEVKEPKTEGEISLEEERKLLKRTEEPTTEKRNLTKIDVIKEEKKVPKKVNILETPEYRNAWAKKLMGIKLAETEERALGDAITTTATTFVESDTTTQGINNGGLFIPTDVRLEMLKIIEKQSPFLKDIRKLAVAGNIDMPYLNASDDAEWYSETSETKNEGQEYKTLKLTGHELAKQIEITWKLEAMAVEEFIRFITAELANKMGRALATAVLYGNGSGRPTGALNGLEAVSGEEVIDAMIKSYASLSAEMKIGAKAYLSSALAIQVVGFKDKNGNYPYLQGLNKTALFDVEVDPYLSSTDLLVGNPENYVLNTVEAISINREIKITPRRNIYSTYAIYDGKPYPGAFAKGGIEDIEDEEDEEDEV